MTTNQKIEEIINNKKFLVLVPNLIHIINFLLLYNANYSKDGEQYEMLFTEAITYIIVFIAIGLFIHLILTKIIKDKQKIFIIEVIIYSFFYFNKIIVLTLLITIVVMLAIDNKKYMIVGASYIIIILCIMNCILGIVNILTLTIKIKEETTSYNKVVIDPKKTSPNIYWIHCDAMMSMTTMNMYFNYEDKYLKEYLSNNNYYINEGATLIAGHHTQQALVAMFNPDYYDKIHRQYLEELEKTFIDENQKTQYAIKYTELTDKRLNSELISAFGKKGYKTISISEFNQYSSLYTDYMFDYYSYKTTLSPQLRYMTKENNSYDNIVNYIDFVHLYNVGTIFSEKLSKVNFLNYEVIDYNSFDTSTYENINNSEYKIAKIILKSLEMSTEIESNKFVFIDFPLNHLPLKVNKEGKAINAKDEYNLDYYLDSYIHSTYLLTDILKFIKNNDRDSIIIIQGDHGLHTIDSKSLEKTLNINNNEVQDIRNSVISAIYIPEKYQNGDEGFLSNPLNISRYLVNNFVGQNYSYIK